MHDIAPGAQATLDQLGQSVLDMIYLEHQHKNPQAEALGADFRAGKLTKEQYVQQIRDLFKGDNEGFVTFMLNSLTDSAKRKEAVEKYILARSMVDVSTTT